MSGSGAQRTVRGLGAKVRFPPIADMGCSRELVDMSRDLKNSILLWVGTLTVFGIFLAGLHFDVGPDIPGQWDLPIVGILMALTVARWVWDHSRKRKV